MLEISLSALQWTRCLNIIKSNVFMPFNEITVIYSENHVKRNMCVRRKDEAGGIG